MNFRAVGSAIRPTCFAFAFFALGPSVARAQVDTILPMAGRVSLGYALPVGRTSDRLDDGYDLSGGIQFRSPSDPAWGLTFDLGYARFDAKHQVLSSRGFPLSARVDDGYHAVMRLTIGGSYDFGGKGRVGGSVGVGIGAYRRHTTLTETVLVGEISCDPLDPFFCLEAGDGTVLETNDWETNLGYTVNAALRFPLGDHGEFTLEAAYHRAGDDPATDTEYVPISVGYRW